MQSLTARLTRFRDDDGGTMVLEATLVLPMMLWAFLGLYTYWDAYRAATTIQKASYAISDMISREQRPVNAAYIEGMRQVMDAMIAPELNSEIRVTSVEWSGVREQFEVLWSRESGTSLPALTTATLQQKADQIPDMNDGDTIMLVETWVDYEPMLDVGITDKRFEQFIVTRPRYSPKIVYQ